MKKIINFILILGLIGGMIYYIEPITNYLASILSGENKIYVPENNEYAKDYDFQYVKLVDNFTPYSYQDLLNIYYTILNNGTDTFTFYCPDEYENCLSDITKLNEDDNTLTHINNFVHPYNTFNNIQVISNSSGEITINVEHLYQKEEIININNEIEKIIKEIITEELNTQEKIKAFHDYIINNTKYDNAYIEGSGNINSSKANGLLFNHLAVCGGYADVMSIFLSKINVKNYKIASETHVWNALYLNDESRWIHLDLTWDDPVTINSNVDTLLHKFFLIDTTALKKFNTENHNYDVTIYQELA